MTDGGKDLRVIIAGGGRVGFAATKILHEHGHDVIVIEEDRDQIERIGDDYVATVIVGDATQPSILDQAAPGDCDVVAALTGDTATNETICTAARRANDDVRTVIRVTDPDDERGFGEVADHVVFPEHEGGKVAADLVEGRTVRRLSGITGDVEVMVVEVDEGAPAAGKRLENVNFPRGSLVVSDRDGDTIAGPESVFDPGEEVIVAVEPGVAREVRQLLRG